MTQTERAFQDAVIEYARLRNWRVMHQRPARTDKGWRTAIQGDPGFPDLVLARYGVVILAELKRDRKAKVTDDQTAWLWHSNGCLWTPDQWDEIERMLA